MPIRRELRCLYPPHWLELSRRIRFERGGGRCQTCGRPHLVQLRCLPDGRWFGEAARTWGNRRGKPCRWPDLIEAAGLRFTRVVLATAHLDGNPANNRLRNLRSLCQRCHVLHDEEFTWREPSGRERPTEAKRFRERLWPMFWHIRPVRQTTDAWDLRGKPVWAVDWGRSIDKAYRVKLARHWFGRAPAAAPVGPHRRGDHGHAQDAGMRDGA